MGEAMDHDNQQSRLWRQYLAQAPPASPDLPALDLNLLAAYLEGSANPKQLEQIESCLASDPALLEELIELRQLGQLKPAEVCPSLLERAKALSPATKLIRHSWASPTRWAAAAAAVMLAGLAGYSVGRDTFQGQQYAETLVAARASQEMQELISEPSLAISLPLNGNNGR